MIETVKLITDLTLQVEEFNYYLEYSFTVYWWSTVTMYFSLTLAIAMQGKPIFPSIEWRFNEFANSGAHALHVSCVELMALPSNPTIVANMLLNVLLKG